MVIVTPDDTHWHSLRKTPFQEGSARRRGLYLQNTQHSQETNIHAPGAVWTLNPSNNNKQSGTPQRVLFWTLHHLVQGCANILDVSVRPSHH
jgi:hypothetical protein